MKKITISILSIALSTAAFAHMAAVPSLENEKTVFDAENVMPKHKTPERTNTPEVAIWSEDFASGIPSGWTNTASNTNGLWVYRGPSTTPSNASGSIGAYSGVSNTPPTNAPIASPTTANGFVIFDSDYLDNGGVPGAFGTGAAAAPHFATLATGNIDLSTNPSVELSFYQYYRRFAGGSTSSQEIPATYLSFSSDGGTTWGDRITLNRDIFVNYASANAEMITLNVSDYIGGSSTARIRFEFDGDYYFWMIDDIELNVAPVNEFRFTNWYGGGAPALDVANADTNFAGKYGMSCYNNATDEIRGYSFDANVVNYGTGAQTNVKLTMKILDANNTLVTSATSAIKASVAAGDTVTFNDLNTYSSPWTAGTTAANYRIVYEVSSQEGTVVTDTINYRVSATHMGIDRGTFFNSWGSANNCLATANVYEFSDDVEISSVRVGLASTSTVGGQMEVYICESANFNNASNPPSTILGGSPSAYTITQADLTAGYADIPVTDGFNPDRVPLVAGTYYIDITFPTGTSRVSLLNDVSIDQANGMCIYFSSSQNQWYGGNTGSNICNALYVRPMLTSSHINIAEEMLKASVSVGPNPANDFVNVMFNDIEGDFTMTMTDVTGRVVSSEAVNVLGAVNHTLDVSSLSAGVYMLNVNNGSASVTYKISVQ